MRIWTTTEVCELMSCEGLPLKLVPGEQFKDSFVLDAAADDIALLKFDDGYFELVARLGERGMRDNVIFVSTSPVAVTEEAEGAVVLDLSRMKEAEARRVIDFIIRVVERRQGEAGQEDRPAVVITAEEKAVLMGLRPEQEVKVQAVRDGDHIRRLIRFSRESGSPLQVEFMADVPGGAFHVRGTAIIKDIRDKDMVVHRLTPAAIRLGLGPGGHVTMFIGDGQVQYRGEVVAGEVDHEGIVLSLPTQLWPAASRTRLRVESGRVGGLSAHVLAPGWPTAAVRVADLCPNGLGFLDATEMEIGTSVSIALLLGEDGGAVLGSGVIQNRTPYEVGFRYGLRMLLHPDDERVVQGYITERNREFLEFLEGMA